MICRDWTKNIPSGDWGDIVLLGKYEHIVCIAQDILDFNWSVRQVAKNYCIGKSTVSLWIDKYLSFLDYDLYVEVKNRLKQHKAHPNSMRRYKR